MAIWRHYALCDPRIRGKNKRVRYVGRTEQTIAARFKEHLGEARRGDKYHRCDWLRKMLREGVEVLIIDLGLGDDSRETELIAWYRTRGADLTNGTDGGDGMVNPTPEVRAKMSTASKKQMADPTYRAKALAQLAAGGKKAWQDPAYREKQLAKLAAANKQRWTDPERRESMSAAKKKQWTDPEYRESMAAATKKHWQDPEYREKMLAVLAANSTKVSAAKQRWTDPTYRAKALAQLAAGGKKAWQDPAYREKQLAKLAAARAKWANRTK